MKYTASRFSSEVAEVRTETRLVATFYGKQAFKEAVDYARAKNDNDETAAPGAESLNDLV